MAPDGQEEVIYIGGVDVVKSEGAGAEENDDTLHPAYPPSMGPRTCREVAARLQSRGREFSNGQIWKSLLETLEGQDILLLADFFMVPEESWPELFGDGLTHGKRMYLGALRSEWEAHE